MSTPREIPHRQRRGRMASGLVFVLFALIALFFLFTEHRAHVLGAIPYLLLLACPLLHMFHGHGGHGHDKAHHHRAAEGRSGSAPSDAKPH
jgi:hypothetical protein